METMADKVHQIRHRRPLISHREYTIALFCVLTVELIALRSMLDEIHDDFHADSANTYIFGSLSNHNVVIVIVSEPGNTYSGIVAARFREDFPSIQHGIVVGVGGGVPGAHGEHGIRLGDVVVAEASSVSPAVVQFDKGKRYASRGFELSGQINKPPSKLTDLVKKLKATHLQHENLVSYFVTDMLRRHPKTAPEYNSPGSEQDQLYEASYEHIGGNDCTICPKERVIRRPTREPDQPHIHYGTIGTSNCVIKSAIERERLGDLYKLRCVEMEAGGIVDQLPCLVVRGICDYADSHKNKKWQPYAAATAAAYVKELLREYSSSRGYQTVVTEQLVARSPEDDVKYKALLKSLTFPRMDARQRNILQPLPRTCEWLKEHQEFRNWMDPDKRDIHHGFLWIKGKPGSGKSTLMKILLAWEAKKKQQYDTLAFFFNARAPSELEKSSEGLYRSLTHQLVVACPAAQTFFLEQFASKEADGEVDEWTVEELKLFLIDAVSEHLQKPLVILIDALDEGDEADVRQLISFLEDIADTAHYADRILRICLSSRHYPHISITHGAELVMEKQTGHDEDIEKYIGRKLRGDKSASMEELQKEIRLKSDSVFLWIVLVVPILNEAYDHGEQFDTNTISHRLKDIPQGLDDLFAKILAKSEQDLSDCLTSLQWVLYSRQSLSPTQLFLAVAITSTSTRFDGSVTSPERIRRCLLDTTRGLTEISTGDPPVVQFIHETVREFLKKRGLAQIEPRISENVEGESHDKIKTCCCKYIENCVGSAHDNRYIYKPDYQAQKIALESSFPLLEYAVTNLFQHANMAQRVGKPQRDWVKQYIVSDAKLPQWIYRRNAFQSHQSKRYTPQAPLLYIMADMDLQCLLQLLVAEGVADERSSETHGTALQAACARGQDESVRLLLQGGAQPNVRAGPDRYAMITAMGKYARRRKTVETIIQLLLDAGADVNMNGPDRKFKKPLYLAVERCLESVVKLLLDAGADVNARSKIQNSGHSVALQAVCVNGHAQIARYLIDYGADIGVEDGDHQSGLHIACSYGHEEIVRLLIDNGADVNAQHGDGVWRCTSFYTACAGGHERIVRFLIDHGADINARGGQCGNALRVACNYHHEHIVRLLIDEGVIITFPTLLTLRQYYPQYEQVVSPRQLKLTS